MRYPNAAKGIKKIYLAEILGIDLQKEIEQKIEKNRRRVYKVIDGVTTKVYDGEEKTEN